MRSSACERSSGSARSSGTCWCSAPAPAWRAGSSPAAPAALNDARVTWPTFGLALAVLDDPHWSAVSPARPLRYWQLVDVDRGSLLHAPLRIDERILQFLIGVPAVDERLQALARPVQVGPAPAGADAVRAVRRRSAPAPATGSDDPGGARAAPADRHGTAPPGRAPSSASASAAACGRTASTRATSPPRPSSASSSRACGPARRRWPAPRCTCGRRTATASGDISAWLELTDAPVAIEVRPGTAAEQLDGLRLHLADLSAR